jgi:hypothetical protein
MNNLPQKSSHSSVRRLSPLRDFLHTESSGAVLLAIAAVVALIWANSPWSASYESLWATKASISFAGHSLDLDLRHWVNDGLMTIFFFVVGLEIKREVTHGHLSNRRAALLPGIAAISQSEYVWASDTGDSELPDRLFRNAKPTPDLPEGDYKVVFFVRESYEGPVSNIAEIELPFVVEYSMM